ncbi:mitochondrial inner membrane protein OXA1L isoform X2 [Dromaius novaehollandiae]|uniref:mitochondrial inner membrane protein OXA1L isoform X2 n=1 Tax=Dromaius novaehollandiae TaxID=8790 RepID=UPI00311EA242
MMAAAAPRLRPLLRALRLQAPRGPLLPHRPLLALGPAARALSTAGPQTPAAAPESPAVGPAAAVGPEAAAAGPGAAVGPDAVGLEAAVGPDAVGLEDLGLGGYSPVGLVQNLLQFLHFDVGLPWWAAIALGTAGARAALLPLVVGAQRQAARLAPHLPHLQRLGQRLQEARRLGDPRQVTLAYTELAAYQKAHDVNPLRGFLVPLVQAPVFVSFFVALRRMAAVPAPGFGCGGVAWFPDLAAPDPLGLLPLLVTASTWLVLELGAETGVSSPGAGPARQLLRLLPLLFLPIIFHFPTAVLTYWLASNVFGAVHVGLLRVPGVRARLRLPPPPPPAPPGPGLLHSLRKGPLRQTFAQNPLQQPGGPAPAPPPPPRRPWKDTLG